MDDALKIVSKPASAMHTYLGTQSAAVSLDKTGSSFNTDSRIMQPTV